MNLNPNISEIAALIAEPSRAKFLMCLMDGCALPAGELARTARITPQTASSHLIKMLEGGLLTMETHGRHRYYRIANKEVAAAVEALSTISPVKKVRSLRESEETRTLCNARTCYDHLAGRLGVKLTEAIVDNGLLEALESNYILTEKGKQFFETIGIDVPKLISGRRNFARQCLDWSERRHHIAGALGASLTIRLFELEWIVRIPGGRAVRVTEIGKKQLFETFNLQLT